ncbi:MAG TPA: hypothetical protein PLW97_00880 [Synergistaceae bacterium]|nr:hypothetical protein [Synergistaceae bacterium]HPQ36179.1 hypothetical protein [Synergistaceae bacterium]
MTGKKMPSFGENGSSVKERGFPIFISTTFLLIDNDKIQFIKRRKNGSQGANEKRDLFLLNILPKKKLSLSFSVSRNIPEGPFFTKFFFLKKRPKSPGLFNLRKNKKSPGRGFFSQNVRINTMANSVYSIINTVENGGPFF